MPLSFRAFGALAFLAAGPAAAEPFTLFVYERADQLALRSAEGPEAAGYWAAYAEFAAAATAAGVLRGGAPLALEADATTLTAAGVTEGPYAAAPLALGGYFQLDVADRAAALNWAAQLPAAASGAVEIREGFPAPTM